LKRIDYLIVGQGLAGSILCYKLLSRGKKVYIVDLPQKNTASKVAAGIFNPITGKRWAKTWMADKIFPYLFEFYSTLEETLDQQFFNPIGIYRPFNTIEQQNEWMGRNTNPIYSKFIDQVNTEPVLSKGGSDKYGGLSLRYAGYIEMSSLLNSFKDYFERHKIYFEDKLLPENISLKKSGVVWKDLHINKIIFCEGIDATRNTFFKWLPFSLVKGELILIKGPFRFNSIIIKGIFVIPMGNGYFKAGATYEKKFQSVKCTDKAREKLANQLQNMFQTPFKIVGQWAGIRPANRDRRPFIGLHPQLQNIGIFNGFGTKGVSLIPYFSELFIESLESDIEMMRDTNISRFFSLYYKSF